MNDRRRPPWDTPPNFAPAPRRKRVWSLLPAVFGAIAYVVLYLLLQPWLNESSDVAFFLSLGLLTLVLAFTVYAFARAIWGKRPDRPRTRPAGGGAAGPDAGDGYRDPEEETDSKVVH